MPIPIRLLALALAFAPVPANAAELCQTISSTAGWQTLQLPAAKVRKVRYSGSWTVINGQFGKVGPRGYAGKDAQRLGPYYKYKYDQSYAFGEMLVRDAAGRTVPFAEFAALARNSRTPQATLAFRINDLDIALRDNAGAITVCIDLR